MKFKIGDNVFLKESKERAIIIESLKGYLYKLKDEDGIEFFEHGEELTHDNLEFRNTFISNILKMTDSYKVSHIHGYVKGLKRIQSYLESRGGKYNKTLFFGLQYFLKRYLVGKVISFEKINEADVFWGKHLGPSIFPRTAWEKLLQKHNGYLPIRIRAVQEGSLIPTGNALLTIENTDEDFPWLVNYLETLILQVWYATTIATQEWETRESLKGFLRETGDIRGIDFKVHDFGYRGVTSPEQAAIGAAAHLVSFMGTDTVAGIELLQSYYGAGMCGFSIPATEHSIMCSFGKANEVLACENWLNQYPKGLIACVSDTYDIYNACANIWGGVLKEKVLSRDGCLVIRPDSGDFFEVIPRVLATLWDKFGGSINDKGFMVLDPHIRVIQGDGMNPETIVKLYQKIIGLGWSADNLVVGSGGGMLMNVNRDTCKFAIKANAAFVNDKWIDIFKSPVTDPDKKSKTGRLELVSSTEGIISTVRIENVKETDSKLLKTVFEDGKLVIDYSLNDIKKHAGIIN